MGMLVRFPGVKQNFHSTIENSVETPLVDFAK